MIRGVHHIAVSTSDLDRLVEFYTELFGFEQVMDGGWSDRPVFDEIVGLSGSAARQAMLRSGNAYLEIFEYSSHAGHPAPAERTAADRGYTHFCLDVQDIDAEYERLAAAGMRFHCPPPKLAGGRVRATYGRDPDGNIVEIQEIVDTSLPFALEQAELIADRAADGAP
jgi:catechol 2,3-dioxygenase-like lactoylglutathione lyase family enzyme